MKIESRKIEVGTFVVKSTYTLDMITDINNMKGFFTDDQFEKRIGKIEKIIKKIENGR